MDPTDSLLARADERIAASRLSRPRLLDTTDSLLAEADSVIASKPKPAPTSDTTDSLLAEADARIIRPGREIKKAISKSVLGAGRAASSALEGITTAAKSTADFLGLESKDSPRFGIVDALQAGATEARKFYEQPRPALDRAPGIDWKSRPILRAGLAATEALPQFVAGAAASIAAKSPAPMMALYGTTAYGDTYASAKAAGVSEPRAQTTALLNAAWNTISERFGFGALLEAPKRTILRNIAAGATRESIQESIQQLGQNAIEKYGFDPGREYWDGLADAAAGAFILGGGGGAFAPRARPGAPAAAPAPAPSANDWMRVPPAPGAQAPAAAPVVPVTGTPAAPVVPVAGTPPAPLVPVNPVDRNAGLFQAPVLAGAQPIVLPQAPEPVAPVDRSAGLFQPPVLDGAPPLAIPPAPPAAVVAPPAPAAPAPAPVQPPAAPAPQPAASEPVSPDTGIDARISAAESAGVVLSDADKAAIRSAQAEADQLNARASRLAGSDPLNKGTAFPMGVGFTRETKRSNQRIDASVRKAGESVKLTQSARARQKSVDDMLAGKGTEADKQARAAKTEQTQRDLAARISTMKPGDKVGAYSIVRINKDKAGLPISYTFTGPGIVKGVQDKVDIVKSHFDNDRAKYKRFLDDAAAPAQPIAGSNAQEPTATTGTGAPSIGAGDKDTRTRTSDSPPAFDYGDMVQTPDGKVGYMRGGQLESDRVQVEDSTGARTWYARGELKLIARQNVQNQPTPEADAIVKEAIAKGKEQDATFAERSRSNVAARLQNEVIGQRQEIPAKAVEDYQLDLPAGYVLDGNRYVFREPPTAAATAPGVLIDQPRTRKNLSTERAQINRILDRLEANAAADLPERPFLQADLEARLRHIETMLYDEAMGRGASAYEFPRTSSRRAAEMEGEGTRPEIGAIEWLANLTIPADASYADLKQMETEIDNAIDGVEDLRGLNLAEDKALVAVRAKSREVSSRLADHPDNPGNKESTPPPPAQPAAAKKPPAAPRPVSTPYTAPLQFTRKTPAKGTPERSAADQRYNDAKKLFEKLDAEYMAANVTLRSARRGSAAFKNAQNKAKLAYDRLEEAKRDPKGFYRQQEVQRQTDWEDKIDEAKGELYKLKAIRDNPYDPDGKDNWEAYKAAVRKIVEENASALGLTTQEDIEAVANGANTYTSYQADKTDLENLRPVARVAMVTKRERALAPVTQSLAVLRQRTDVDRGAIIPLQERLDQYRESGSDDPEFLAKLAGDIKNLSDTAADVAAAKAKADTLAAHGAAMDRAAEFVQRMTSPDVDGFAPADLSTPKGRAARVWDAVRQFAARGERRVNITNDHIMVAALGKNPATPEDLRTEAAAAFREAAQFPPSKQLPKEARFNPSELNPDFKLAPAPERVKPAEPFDAVKSAASTDDTRYVLNSVYVDAARGVVVSTDGGRLHVAVDPTAREEKIIRLTKKGARDGVMDGERFPSWNQVFPKIASKAVEVDVQDLLAQANAIDTFYGRVTDADYHSARIYLGDTAVANVRADYLADAARLMLARGIKTAQIMLDDDVSPMLMAGIGQGGPAAAILMPMRGAVPLAEDATARPNIWNSIRLPSTAKPATAQGWMDAARALFKIDPTTVNEVATDRAGKPKKPRPSRGTAAMADPFGPESAQPGLPPISEPPGPAGATPAAAVKDSTTTLPAAEAIGKSSSTLTGEAVQLAAATSRNRVKNPIRAYHGTSADNISRFDVQKIGEGEGAQAFGWGLYFAEDKDIAEYYRKTVGGDNGKLYEVDIYAHEHEFLNWDEHNLKNEDDITSGVIPASVAIEVLQWQNVNTPEELLDELRSLSKSTKYDQWNESFEQDIDRLVDSPGDFESVKSYWAEVFVNAAMTGEEVYRKLSAAEAGNIQSENAANVFGDPRRVSIRLLQSGIPGIKFYDANSRRSHDTRNFVIFDDSIVRVINAHPALSSKPHDDLTLQPPTTAELDAEAAQRAARDTKRAQADQMAARAAAPLQGDSSAVGQGTLFAQDADLFSGQAAQDQAAATPAPGLTPDAEQLISTAAAGMPAFVTNNMRAIAAKNGITVTGDMTPAQVIEKLQAKRDQGGKSAPPPTKKPRPSRGTAAMADPFGPESAQPGLPPISEPPGPAGATPAASPASAPLPGYVEKEAGPLPKPTDPDDPRFSVVDMDMPELVAIMEDLAGGRHVKVREKMRRMGVLGTFRSFDGFADSGQVTIRADQFRVVPRAVREQIATKARDFAQAQLDAGAILEDQRAQVEAEHRAFLMDAARADYVQRNQADAMMVLRHELGHHVDFLEAGTLKRGNILGHVAALKKYMRSVLPLDPNSNEDITPKDRARFRREAERLAGTRPAKTDTGAMQTWSARVAELYSAKVDEAMETRGLVSRRQIMEELIPLFQWYTGQQDVSYFTTPEEAYAEAFSILLNNPVALGRRAPLTYGLLTNYMNERPNVRAEFDLWNQKIQAGTSKMDAAERLRDNTRKANEIADEERLRRDLVMPGTVADNVLFHIDRVFGPVYRRLNKIAKRDPGTAAATRATIGDYRYRGASLEAFALDTQASVVKRLLDAGIHWETFSEYLFHNRVAFEPQSQDVANPGGWNAPTSKARLEEMKAEQGPAKAAILEESRQQFRRAYEHHVLSKLEGVLSEGQVAELLDREYYATFAAVRSGKAVEVGQGIEAYLTGRFGSGVTAKIYKRVGNLGKIRDPAAATFAKGSSLISFAAREKAKAAVVDMLQTHFRSEITPARREFTGPGRVRYVEEQNINVGTIYVMRNGDLEAFYVPRAIADAFQGAARIENNAMIGALATGMGVFKGTLTGANPTFWPVALTRDIFDFLRKMPGRPALFFGQKALLRYLPKSMADAASLIRGNPTEAGMRALEMGVVVPLGTPQGEAITSEGNSLEREILKHTTTTAQYRRKMLEVESEIDGFWYGVSQFFRGALKIGTVFERSMKIAGMHYLEANFPGMSLDEKKHVIRTLSGSPDFLDKGASNLLIDVGVQMFYNPWKQGWRSELDSFQRGKADYLIQNVKYVGVPAMVVLGLAQGWLVDLLGGDDEDRDEIKRMMARISEYTKRNYLAIPLGWADDKQDKVVTLKLPMSDAQKVFYNVALKSMEGNPTEAASAGIDLIAGTMMGDTGTPWAKIVKAYYAHYVDGQNPIDNRLKRGILDPDVHAARHLTAANDIDMMKWAWNQSGVGTLFHRFRMSRDPGVATNETPTENLLSMPFVSAGLGRWLGVESRGITEQAARLVAPEEERRAFVRLQVDRFLAKEPLTPDERTALQRDPYAAEYLKRRRSALNRRGPTTATRAVNTAPAYARPRLREALQ